ncbi:MAG: hypothetical protein JW937_01795 [Candidatus Omnitrophica bacterium]|nr:hypothetical protein [Candidatus Omnitrophota bacterium]
MKVLILGRQESLYNAAKLLAEQTSHEVVAIITSKSMPEYLKDEKDFENLAAGCGAPFLKTQNLDENTLKLIKKSNADIGVSLNWPALISQEVLDMFPLGILNAHSGNLPRFRGNAVANWAILNGEDKIVFTIHQMVASGVDEGAILLQREMPLNDETTIQDINERGALEYPAMFAEVLAGLEAGNLSPIPQSIRGVSPVRCYPRLPRDGRINWSLPAMEIHALVRSLTKPYAGAFTYYRDSQDKLRRLYIWKTRLAAPDGSGVLGMPGHVIENNPGTGESRVLTGDGILTLCEASHGLEESTFKPGKLWKSVRMRLGMDVEEEIFRIISTTELRST